MFDLGQLTVNERVSLLSGSGMWTTQAIERAGVPSIRLSDGPHGLRRQPDGGDHLGIGHSAPATCFPPAVALGCSWDPDLARLIGQALGREALAQDVQVLLGPGINIKRSPLGGRNFEYFSEDPLLTGVLGAAVVEGVQSQGVGACLKHFAANNQETDRFVLDVQVDERTLREIYLAAFEHVVKTARPWTVMCAYNKLNGSYAAQHRWLLTQVLRQEWGFDGLVVSDWGAVDDRVAALEAGLDLEMPTSGGVTDRQMLAALHDGTLAEQAVDESAARVLALVERCSARPADIAAVDYQEHHRLARYAAGQCAVLLKNDGVLPLDPSTSVAVIGELARTPRYQGAGSSTVNATRFDDALRELRARADRPITFAAGYRLDGDEPDPELEAQARSVAATAQVTVVFLGLPPGAESEGYDRTSLDLPANQRALLSVVAQTGTRVVVVLSNGGVVTTSQWDHHAAAILEGWLLGQAGGGAVADILTGAVNPSGRLAETIPVRLQDTASYLSFPGECGQVRYGEGVFVGYRYHDSVDGPVGYPFGHGLSYTTFAYSDLTVSAHGRDEQLAIEVSAQITNTGTRGGSEVAQLYVGPPSTVVRRPVKQLRGFAKVTLRPGEDTTVRFTLGWRDLAYFHPTERRWTVEPGRVGVMVGASSRDIRLTDELVVKVTRPVVTLTADSTVAEWMSTEAGRDVLVREMRPDGTSPGLSRFLDDDYVKTIASVPVSRLARFPGTHLDPDRLDALADEVNSRPSQPPGCSTTAV